VPARSAWSSRPCGGRWVALSRSSRRWTASCRSRTSTARPRSRARTAAAEIDVLTSAVVQGVAREAGLRPRRGRRGWRHHTHARPPIGCSWRSDATRTRPRRALTSSGILDDRGFVITDEWGATSVEGVWAVGDVRPTLALAHAAFAEGFAVADRIAGRRPRPPGRPRPHAAGHLLPSGGRVGRADRGAEARDVASVTRRSRCRTPR
jgi:hypothetical protein